MYNAVACLTSRHNIKSIDPSRIRLGTTLKIYPRNQPEFTLYSYFIGSSDQLYLKSIDP